MDHQRHPALPDQPVTEDLAQRPLEPAGRVLGAPQPANGSPPERVSEDPTVVVEVELEDLGRRHPRAQAERRDPAGRGPDDEVEAVDDPNAEIELERRQEGDLEDAAHAAAVEREHLEAIA